MASLFKIGNKNTYINNLNLKQFRFLIFVLFYEYDWRALYCT